LPSRFSGSVHNAAAAQIAIDLNAHGMNCAPSAGEISFESALWQGIHQLVANEADIVLAGSVDELNKYPLGIGKRWGLWSDRTRPGEGAMMARLMRAPETSEALARITAVRLGRYRKPFDAEREADWIESVVSLNNVDVILSGAHGWPRLDEKYNSVVAALSTRAGRTIEHQTYKQHCGEFHSASAFGFSAAVELVRNGCRGVLLYTLAPRGGKAITLVQP
jgi:hypothetical protein